MKTYSIPFVFLSLLSDSNQRPRDFLKLQYSHALFFDFSRKNTFFTPKYSMYS